MNQPWKISIRKLAWAGLLLLAAALILAFIQPLRLGSGLTSISMTRLLAILIPFVGAAFAWTLQRLRPNGSRIFKKSSRRFDALVGLCLTGFAAAALPVYLRMRFAANGEFADKVLFTLADPAALTFFGCALFLLPSLIHAQKRETRAMSRTFAALFIAFLAVALLIAQSGFGLKKDNAFWGLPTVPILEVHFVLVFISACAALRLALTLNLGSNPRMNALLPIGIYALAVALWLALPLQHGFFAPQPREPNFETYPFSDGAFYGHYARALINGMGYKGADLPPRPLYILILALAHLPFGVSYNAVITVQTLILALLPVMIYQLGRELHGRIAGLAAALLFIARETHAILAAPYAHNVSNTRYFFADLPTALALTFFFWTLIRLVKTIRAGRPAWVRALSCGGALGIAVLIRTQSLFLSLLSLPVLFFAGKPSIRRRMALASLFALGVALCVAPWLIRSRLIFGSFVFDHPRTQTGELAASYNLGGFDISREVGMSDGAYQEKLGRVIRENLQTYPLEIAAFVGAHFVNSLVSSVRLLPMRTNFAEWSELFGGTPFWETELTMSATPVLTTISLIIALAFLAFGVAALIRRSGWVGSLPLMGLLIFHFSTALGRYSAGRYLIPMDWALFLVIGAGMSELIRTLACRSGFLAPATLIRGEARPTNGSDAEPGQFRASRLILTGVIYLLVGSALVVVPALFPMTLDAASPAQIAEKLSLTSDEAARYDYLHNAIAIYPRYYAPGEGEPESAKVGYDVADEGRLMFLTLAPEGFGTVRLKLDDAPSFFPDNATVWIAGKLNGAVTDAAVVVVEDEGRSFRYEAEP